MPCMNLTIDNASSKTCLIVEVEPTERGGGVVPAN